MMMMMMVSDGDTTYEMRLYYITFLFFCWNFNQRISELEYFYKLKLQRGIPIDIYTLQCNIYCKLVQ